MKKHITAHGGLASDEEIPGADEQAKEAEWYSRKGTIFEEARKG